MTEKLLEQKKRFSKSILWELQANAYQSFGIEAWSRKGVPSYLTSNPFTVGEYACVFIGYLRDCLSEGAATPLDLSEPINILDLGAGSGRFAYLFLKEVMAIIRHIPLFQKVRIRYIMTDIAEDNIKFWQQHPYFQNMIKEGVLDFAHYQHDLEGQPLNLIHSKQVLTTSKNPLVLIANYFFDTIPQDLFCVKKGKLHEGRVSLHVPDESSVDVQDPAVIEKLEAKYDYFPVEDADNYYPDCPEYNAILKEYTQTFLDTPFLLPVGAFQALNYFANIANGRLLLLAADQGLCTESQVREAGEPRIDRHGTFSIPVSYHALSAYFHYFGGTCLRTRFPDPMFVVMTGILGGSLDRFPETYCTFHHNFEAFEPKDYWKLVSNVERVSDTPPLELILGLLKLGKWDPILFHTFYEKIRQLLPKLSDKEIDYLSECIHRVWEHFFPIDPLESDFVLNLGVLFYELKRYSDAILYFQRALDIQKENSQAWNNMGACYLALQDSQAALNCFQKA